MRFCIVLAVFLVTAIFGMADMEIRNQKQQEIQSNGGWHAMFRSISKEQAGMIAARPEIIRFSSYAVANYRLDKEYYLGKKKVGICGFGEDFMEILPSVRIEEGRFPKETDEAVVTKSAKEALGIQIGDSVELDRGMSARGIYRDRIRRGYFHDEKDGCLWHIY